MIEKLLEIAIRITSCAATRFRGAVAFAHRPLKAGADKDGSDIG